MTCSQPTSIKKRGKCLPAELEQNSAIFIYVAKQYRKQPIKNRAKLFAAMPPKRSERSRKSAESREIGQHNRSMKILPANMPGTMWFQACV